MNEMRRVSAASVDSQFPVDPRYAGPLAGWLAPLGASAERQCKRLQHLSAGHVFRERDN
jgi:hypothetical protein